MMQIGKEEKYILTPATPTEETDSENSVSVIVRSSSNTLIDTLPEVKQSSSFIVDQEQALMEAKELTGSLAPWTKKSADNLDPTDDHLNFTDSSKLLSNQASHTLLKHPNDAGFFASKKQKKMRDALNKPGPAFVIQNGSELHYAGCVFTYYWGYEGILGVFGSKNYLVIPEDLNTTLILGWNFADGIDSVFGFVRYLLQDDHHTMQNRGKGLISLLSGLDLLLLSYNPWFTNYLGEDSPLAAAGWAFVGSTIGDLILAVWNLITAYKVRDFPGWLEEHIDELVYVHYRIQAETQATPEDTVELTKLRQKHSKLMSEITTRCKCNNTKHSACIKEQLQKLSPLKCTDASHEPIISDVSALSEPNHLDKKIEAKIQQEMAAAYSSNQITVGVKIVSFLGMLFSALDPKASTWQGEAGIVMVQIIALYYAIKYLAMAVNFFMRYCSSMEQEESKEQKMDQHLEKNRVVMAASPYEQASTSIASSLSPLA